MIVSDFAEDVPADLARAAHRGTSHDPEKRGEQERADYCATLGSDYARLAEAAEKAPDPDAALARLAEEFARYRLGYRRRFLVYLARRSQCLSTMITGPSGFNVRRAEKANRGEHRASESLAEYRTRALAAIRRAVRPDLQPIMSGDSDAVERLRAEVAKLERLQDQMKACNAVIRRTAKDGPEAQVAALVALGWFGEGRARDLLKPDFCGRVGFADFEIKNNGANIRRLRARLAVVEASKAAPAVESEGAGGVRVEDCPADNRVRLFFPGKPETAVREALKAHGFRWTPSLGCWQAYRNPRALAHAATFATEVRR